MEPKIEDYEAYQNQQQQQQYQEFDESDNRISHPLMLYAGQRGNTDLESIARSKQLLEPHGQSQCVPQNEMLQGYHQKKIMYAQTQNSIEDQTMDTNSNQRLDVQMTNDI